MKTSFLFLYSPFSQSHFPKITIVSTANLRGFSTLLGIYWLSLTSVCAEETTVIINTPHESTLWGTHCGKHFCMCNLLNLYTIPMRQQRQGSNQTFDSRVWAGPHSTTVLILPVLTLSPSGQPHSACFCLFLTLQFNPPTLSSGVSQIWGQILSLPLTS